MDGRQLGRTVFMHINSCGETPLTTLEKKNQKNLDVLTVKI